LPISQGTFFPLQDCEGDQNVNSGSELRPFKSIDGHPALCAAGGPDLFFQVDKNLTDLRAIAV